MANGIIRNYTITILDGNMNSVQSQTVLNLSAVITQLTPNTNYIANVSGFTVRLGDAASETFTTPQRKHVQYLVFIITFYFSAYNSTKCHCYHW